MAGDGTPHTGRPCLGFASTSQTVELEWSGFKEKCSGMHSSSSSTFSNCTSHGSREWTIAGYCGNSARARSKILVMSPLCTSGRRLGSIEHGSSGSGEHEKQQFFRMNSGSARAGCSETFALLGFKVIGADLTGGR